MTDVDQQALHEQRQAILAGPAAMATLRARRQQQARLATARHERDLRLAQTLRRYVAKDHA